jgi:hypothetical protein
MHGATPTLAAFDNANSELYVVQRSGRFQELMSMLTTMSGGMRGPSESEHCRAAKMKRGGARPVSCETLHAETQPFANSSANRRTKLSSPNEQRLSGGKATSSVIRNQLTSWWTGVFSKPTVAGRHSRAQ